MKIFPLWRKGFCFLWVAFVCFNDKYHQTMTFLVGRPCILMKPKVIFLYSKSLQQIAILAMLILLVLQAQHLTAGVLGSPALYLPPGTASPCFQKLFHCPFVTHICFPLCSKYIPPFRLQASAHHSSTQSQLVFLDSAQTFTCGWSLTLPEEWVSLAPYSEGSGLLSP